MTTFWERKKIPKEPSKRKHAMQCIKLKLQICNCVLMIRKVKQQFTAFQFEANIEPSSNLSQKSPFLVSISWKGLHWQIIWLYCLLAFFCLCIHFLKLLCLVNWCLWIHTNIKSALIERLRNKNGKKKKLHSIEIDWWVVAA